MASSTSNTGSTTGNVPTFGNLPPHPNPNVQRVLAFAARRDQLGLSMPSASAITRLAAEHYNMPVLATKAVGRAYRQVLRDHFGASQSRTRWGQRVPGGKVAKASVAARKGQVAQAKRTAKQATPQATPQA